MKTWNPRTVLCGIMAIALSALAAEKPNIVLIMLDDVGTGWMPPYADRLTPSDVEELIVENYADKRNGGNLIDVEKHLKAARTCMPTLAKLAADGAVFDRAFATANLCGPSRAGMLTGSFQQRWGAYRNVDVEDHGIPKGYTVLADPLAAAGYRCGMVGKWHVSTKDETLKEKIWADVLGETEWPIPPGAKRRWKELKGHLNKSGYSHSCAEGQHPLDYGFSYYFGYNAPGSEYYNASGLWENRELVPPRPDGEFLTDLFNEKSCAFIEAALQEENPFLLYYAPMTLHGGIKPPPEHYSESFDTGVRFSNQYAGHLRALDAGLAKMIQMLEKHGQLDNTLIIFTSDNGGTHYGVPPHNAPFRGGKGTGWLGGTHVPFVVWQPGVVKPGINSEIVSLADVMPTVLDAAGVDCPQNMDGLSLLPFLIGTADCGPRISLGSAGLQSSRWSHCYEAGGEVNKKDASDCPLYVWYLDRDHLLLRTTAVQPGLYKILPDGFPARTDLYDLRSDRQQLNNLAGGSPERVRQMDLKINRWLGGMPPPLTSHQEDYRQLKELTQ